MTDSTAIFRILVPSDYSQVCRQALQACASFDWGRPVEVFVLTVQDPMQPRVIAQKDQDQLSACFAGFPADAKIILLEAQGRFVNTVLKVVASKQIDLIVVGTRGARGWEGVFVGSHAEKIVRVSPVPVLAIGQRPHLDGLHTIVVPVDIDRNPDELRDCLAILSGFFNARFHLLYVKTDQTRGQQATVDLLSECKRKLGLPHCVSSVVNAEDIANGVIAYAGQIGADLIAIPTMTNPDPAHMFRPSIAADVVNHAQIPVFTCPLGYRQLLIPY